MGQSLVSWPGFASILRALLMKKYDIKNHLRQSILNRKGGSSQNLYWKLSQQTKLVVLILIPVHSWFRKFFFRNKTFLFFKIQSWNFQHLFNCRSCKTTQNFSSLIQRTHMQNQNKSCAYKLNELKFLFLKQIWSKLYGQISSFINQQMALWWHNFH